MAINASGTCGFYLEAAAPSWNDGLPLFSWATLTNSGQANGLSLYLLASSGERFCSGQMPLFLSGPSQDTISGVLPLWLRGEYATLAEGFPLYLGASGQSASVPFFVRGSGGDFSVDGAIPYQEAMALFIARNTPETMPLFMKVVGIESSGAVGFATLGSLPFSGIFPIFLSGVGHQTGTVKLYCHGY